VQSLQFAGSGPQSLPTAVVLPHPLPAVLSATQQDYTQATPVPTVAVPTSQNGPFTLQASNRGSLSAGSSLQNNYWNTTNNNTTISKHLYSSFFSYYFVVFFYFQD
jgi:hypothetical protein